MASEAPSESILPAPAAGELSQAAAGDAPPLSKNALKRIRKQKKWEDAIEDRRQKRRDKRIDRRARHRSEREALIASGVDPATFITQKDPAVLVPVTLLFDCDFEQYMTDKERTSLSSQVTRSYSDNRQAKYKSHLWISAFNGKLQERFEGPLRSVHKAWKGVSFHDGSWLEAAAMAREAMTGEKAGEMIPALQHGPVAWTKDEIDPIPMGEPEPPLSEEFKDVVYLSSDSPYTLERLEPNTSYVIGGLVDKNREKGLCYRRAREAGIRTAKLPIGQFMVMQSRTVLATNHVVEIMLKWLEFEDWGKAFMSVIPKRKGGRLIGEEDADEDQAENGDEGKNTADVKES